jgi:sporulation protein YlmC with PRC-barrel domain
MKLSRITLLGAATSAFFLLNRHGFSQTESDPPGSLELRNHRLSQIRKMNVEDRDGQSIGAVDNFILDHASGQVRYSVLASGAFLGTGRTLTLVPTPILTMATVKRNTLALLISKTRWSAAPRFQKQDLARLSHGQQRAIQQFYDQGPGPQPTLQSRSKAPSQISPPGREKFQPADRLELANDIVGKTVIDRRQKKLGRISDLLIDVSGERPVFAILSPGGFLKRGTRLAVLVRALHPIPDGKLLLDVGKANQQMFDQAAPFSHRAWRQSNSSNAVVVYRYDETRQGKNPQQLPRSPGQ